MPPNREKKFIKNHFSGAPTPKLHFFDPQRFLTADNFYQEGHRSKVNSFREKVKNHEKMSKIMTFQKKLTSVTSDFSAFLHVPNSPRLMTLYASKKYNDEKLPFLGTFFEKVMIAPPPTSQKVNEGEIRRKNARKKKVVASQIKAACKKLEKVTGTIRRKSPNLTSWVGNAFTSRRGPYPCLA